MSSWWAGRPTGTGGSWAATTRRPSRWTHGADRRGAARLADHIGRDRGGFHAPGDVPRKADDGSQGAGGLHDARHDQRRLAEGPATKGRATRWRHGAAVVPR